MAQTVSLARIRIVLPKRKSKRDEKIKRKTIM